MAECYTFILYCMQCLHLNQVIFLCFAEENLFHTILDLFTAGTDTTTSTLGWILLRLINNPDVQKKCQKEIQKVTISTKKKSFLFC